MAVIAGEGTALFFNGSAIGDVVSISGPNRAVAEVEKTSLDSTTKEFRFSTIPESGTVDFVINFDPADGQHSGIETLMDTPADGTFALRYADSTADDLTFIGFPTSFAYSGMEVEGNLQAEITVKIAGDFA